MGPALLVETLIQHKRRRFGGDRLLADAHVGPGADGPRLHVTRRSLPGYPLG